MILGILSAFRFVYFVIASFFYGLPQSFIAIALVNKFGNERDRKVVLHKFGVRFRRFLQAFGPSFIKLGQTLATRPDAIGEEVASELSMLQDRLPPFAFAKVEQAIHQQLGKRIGDVFREFDQHPKAAASLAQVHRAVTHQGVSVAVKILRPRIELKIAIDLALMKLVAVVLDVIHPNAKLIQPKQVVKQLEESMKRELDLRFEAAAADQIRSNLKDDEYVRIPKVFWDLSSVRVMTTEWIDGVNINDKSRLQSLGFEPNEIARRLAVTFFNQAYRDGFFHADLHPGNIFVTQDGDIALVDFGIVGNLSQRERIFLARMLYGFIQRDYDEVARLHAEIGYLPPHKDLKLFSLACRSIGEPIIGQPVNKISVGKLLKQLFDIAKDFDMAVQPQLILLQKTMITLEGVGYSIYGGVNMWKLAEPWIERWAANNFGVKASLVNIKNVMVGLSHELPSALERINKIIIHMEENTHKQEKAKSRCSYSFKLMVVIATVAGLAYYII